MTASSQNTSKKSYKTKKIAIERSKKYQNMK